MNEFQPSLTCPFPLREQELSRGSVRRGAGQKRKKLFKFKSKKNISCQFPKEHTNKEEKLK